MSTNPTLVVGLGGSGTFVVRRLKRRLGRVFGEQIPPAFQMLAFDTDGQKEEPLLSTLEAEFFRIDDFPADMVVDRSFLPNHPAVQAWWKYQRLYPGLVKQGAQQRPPVGRLALFYHFRSFQDAVTRSIREMFQPTESYNPPQTNSVDVYVIGSSCGGTGAGMFFDTAALAFDAVKSSGRIPVLHGYVFLPSCFGSEVFGSMDSLNANAHLFLRALECVQGSGWPRTNYPDTSVERISPLFNRVHCVSAFDMRGVAIPDLQSICEKLALRLDLEISSSVARQLQAGVVNHPPAWDIHTQGRLTGYSSFGVAQLGGGPDLARLYKLPLLVESTLRTLVQPPTSELSPDADFLSQNEAHVKLNGVLTNDGAALELAPADYHAAVNQLKAVKTVDQAKREVALLLNRIDGFANSCPTDWVRGLKGLEPLIDDEWTKHFVSGPGGSEVATRLLRAVGLKIGESFNRCEKVRGERPESPDLIKGAIGGWFTGDKKAQQVILNQAIPYLRGQTILRIRQRVATAAEGFLQQVLKLTQDRLQLLDALPHRIESIVSELARYRDEEVKRLQASLGPAALTVTQDQAQADFRQESQQLTQSFVAFCQANNLLARLAQYVKQNKNDTAWAALLSEALRDFTEKRGPLATSEDWVDKAVQTILDCQPMVQLTGSPAELGKYPREAVARVYQAEAVRAALSARAPLLKFYILESSDAGSLEAAAAVVNFPLFALQELQSIQRGWKAWCQSNAEPSENRCALRGPADLWKRIQGLDLRALAPDKQALARLLAFELQRCKELADTYEINGDRSLFSHVDTWYQKRRALNEHLVNYRIAEELLEQLRTMGNDRVRETLQGAIEKWETRIARDKGREIQEDWEFYVSMLEDEAQAARGYLEQLP